MPSPKTPAFLALLLLVMLSHSVHAAASESALSVLNSTKEVSVGPSVLAVVAIAVGAVVCVAGYRLFRPTVFVCGFIVGGIAIAYVIEHVFKSQSWMNTASWIGFFLGGIILGFFSMSLLSLSLFIAGAAGGVLLAFTVHTTVAYKVYPSDPNVVLVVLVILLGIIGGVLAIKLERPMLIVTTSFIGAIAVTWGVGYFAGQFPNGADLKAYASADINGDTIISIPSAWWGYLAGIVVLFLFGMMIQFRKTGRGNYHKFENK